MITKNFSLRFLASTLFILLLNVTGISQTTSVVKTFNTSGNVVFGAGVSTVNVSMWGGGGGGSAGGMKEYTNATDYILHPGAGGGGSNWAGTTVAVAPGIFYGVTVGTGGAGGGFDGNNNPLSGGNGTGSLFYTVSSGGGFAGTVSGFNAFGGARAANPVPDPGIGYAENGQNEGNSYGGNGGLSNSGNYGASGTNLTWSGLGYPQVPGISTGGPGTRPGDGGGGGGFSTLPFPFYGMLDSRKAGGKGANGIVTFYISYPTYRLTASPTATKLCGPGASTITLHSTSMSTGLYTVTYNTTNPTTTGNTVAVNFSATTGTGSFSTINLSNSSTITITNIASGNTCSDAISQFNSVTAVVENLVTNSWETQIDFGGTTRSNAVSFTIGSKAYVGTGKNGATLLSDFWQFDQATNSWTQLADFGGGIRTDAVGFSIGAKGYIGTGSDGTNNKNDFWEYDPFTNVWRTRATFSGGARYGAAAFSASNFGYICTGYNGSVYYNDLWQYNATTDSWTAKASFPGAARSLATGFSIAGNGYLGMGTNGTTVYNDILQYSPASNAWFFVPPFPGVARSGAVAFSIGSRGYIGTGWNGTAALNDFYEYDLVLNTWTSKANFGGSARRQGVGFAIGNKGYIGLGLSGSTYNKDMYEYSITNTTINTNALSASAFCIGSSLVVSYSTGCTSFGPGNLFVASLSDSLGNFSGTYTLGSTTVAGGTINCTIPSFVPPGSKYRVRVDATNPSTIGTDNGSDIAIKPTTTATVTAGISNSSICRGQSIDLTASVSTAATSDTTVILNENFNSGATSWLMTNTNSYQFGNTQIYTNGQGGFYSNDNSSFYLTSSSGRFSTDVTNTTLQSPKFNTLGMNSGSLSFWQCYQFGNYNNSDSIRVQISINNGQSWTTIYLNNSSSVGDPQDSLGFVKSTISLNNYMNQPSVVLRFNYGAYGGMGRWMIDNILVKGVSQSNNFTWTSSPAGFSSTLQNPTAIVPTLVPGSTTYTVAFQNSFGCGTVTSNVSVLVKDTSSSTTNISICPSQLPYIWNGLTFNAAGTQIKHLTNAAGCDSAAKLNLVVRAASTSTTTISICPPSLPYTWNGLVFNAAGSQTAHFTNSVGCDSAATLNLVVKPTSRYTINQTICQSSLPYLWNGLTINAAGNQTVHFTNAVGCDSAVTLNLTTVSSVASITANATFICPGTAVNLTANVGSGSTVTVLNEGFNSTDNNWTKINQSSGGIVANAAWTLRPDGYAPYFGVPGFNSNDNSQFYLTNSYDQGTAVTTHTVLQSPVFSTVGLSTASLSFYHQFTHQSTFANDSIRVQISSDGTNWTNLYVNKTATVGFNSIFQLQTISLSSYLNLPTVSLRFVYDGTPIVGGYSNYWWAIDNVAVTGAVAPNTFSWTSVPAGFTSTLQSITGIIPTQTTTYNVAVNNGFCSANRSVLITMNATAPSSTTNLAICPSSLPYTWNGLVFNGAGTQTAHIITAGNCDSSATLNLTISPQHSSVTNLTICPSGLPYTWNGLIFTTAGSKTKLFPIGQVCDSAATLNLTVQTSSSSSTTNLIICENQLPYTWNGLVFASAGTQTQTLTNSFGCDSAAKLNLFVSIKPANVTANASLSNVCAGSPISLSSSAVLNTVIFSENFNSGAPGWTTQNFSTGGTPANAAWTLRPDGYVMPEMNSTFNSNDNSSFYFSNSRIQGIGSVTNTYLQSPVFSTVGYSTASLTFYNNYVGFNSTDSVRIQVSTNNGNTWTRVYLSTVSTQGSSTDFYQQTVSLNAYINQPALMIRFNYNAAYGFAWAIDNVNITGTPLPATYSWSSVPAGFTSSLQNPTGVTPTQATTYNVVASNSNGCTNSASVAVTVKPTSSSLTNVSVCPTALPYIWNGLTFNGAGSQTKHFPNSVGCDSAATLTLFVKAATSSSTSISVCPGSFPYTWNGLTFNAVGTQTAHLPNAAGCDSAASLTLSLRAVSTSTGTLTICASALPYNWNGLAFNSAGSQTAHLMNSVGCDSAATLTLTVNPIPTNVTATSSSTSVCAGSSINLTSSSTSTSGTTAVIFNENFNAPTNNWIKTNSTSGGNSAVSSWTLWPNGYSSITSNDSSQFYISNNSQLDYGKEIHVTLQSPAFSTVGFSTASLSFYHTYWHNIYDWDSIRVQVSTNGINWNTVYLNNSTDVGATTFDFTFVQQTISLNNYINQPNLRIRFNYNASWGGNFWAVDNVKVSGSPANTYSWTSSPAGFTSTLQNPTAVVPTQTTTYTVTASNSFGCSASNSVLVTVNETPSATITYGFSSNCTSGGTASVSQTGTTGGVYSAPAGLLIDPATGAVTLAGSTPGTYTVTYTIAASATCPQYTTTGSITINPNYDIVASAGANGTISSPGTSTLCAETTKTYTINAGACATIADVLVDGISVGPVSSYTFSDIEDNHTISATFTLQTLSATISYSGSPFCPLGTVQPSQTGTTGGTYSSSNGLVINSSTGAVDLAASTPGSYTITYTLVNACTQFTTTASITISAVPSATIAYTGSPYCLSSGTANVTRTGTPGGIYSSSVGLSINSGTGAIDLNASSPGTYTVSYTLAASGGCTQYIATAQAIITTTPSATIAYTNSPYCANGGTATVALNGTSGGTYSSTAGLMINANTGDITLGTSTPGTYTVTYFIAAAGGCTSASATTTLIIVNPTSLSISYSGNPFCQVGNIMVIRTGLAGGIYSSDPGMSVDAATGRIYPGASTPGVHTVTYSVNFPAGCTSSATTTVTVLPTPTITLGTAPTLCFPATPSTALLPYTATTGSPVTYSITANGTNSMPNYIPVTNASLPGTSIPVILPAGTPGGTYYFNLNVTSANGCMSAGRYVFKVIVASQATINIIYNGSPFCHTGVAGVSQTGATGGTYTFSPAGLSINATTGLINLGSSQIGSYTVTYTVTLNGCTYTTTAPVTITALPTITVGTTAPMCASPSAGTVLLPYTSTTGNPITYSLSVGTLNPMPGFTPVTDAALPTGPISIAIPAGTAGGTYTFNLHVKNAQGCSSPGVYVVSVTVVGSNTTISYNGGQPVCQTGVLLVTLSGAPGGTYSSDANLNINSSTGTVYPASSTGSTHTVTYTIVTQAGCTFSTTANVTIVPLPKVTIGTIAPVCVSANAQAASVPYTVTASTPVSYSITVGASNPMPGYVSVTNAASSNPIVVNIPAGTSPGTYSFYLTLKSAGGCVSARYTFFITVKAMPTATITYLYSAYSTSVNEAAVSFSGTSGGTYNSTSGLHLNTSTGTVFPSTSTPGTYTVTYTVTTATNCTATSIAQVTIYGPSPAKIVTRAPVSGSVTKAVPGATLNDAIVIAPNPVQRILTINTTGIDGTMLLHITDAAGKEIMKRTRFSSSFKLDMSSNAAGVYIVEVMDEGTGEVVRRKVVKL